MLRRFRWRLGRRLYMQARGEISNDMQSNGELWLQRQVLARIKASGAPGVVLDVGANIGDWSHNLIKQAPGMSVPTASLKLHAFEPVASTRHMLEKRLAGTMEGADFAVWPIALSNRQGTGQMHVVAAGAGTNSLEAAGGVGEVEEVNLLTLDEFCAQQGIRHIDMVKCDTEGHDLFVMEGAKQLLAEGNISVLQFEYNFRWHFPGRNLKQVFDYFAEFGELYAIGRLCSSKIEVFKEWHPELDRFFETNLVVLRRDVMSTMPCHHGRFDAANTYA